MQLSFHCPGCQAPIQSAVDAATASLHCACGWDRPVRAADVEGGQPHKCLVCGCGDLWRQKDFPQGLGLLMVALGAILSTIAWFQYMPRTALGVLLAFALIDVLLYTFMPDVLVCYRCKARYAKAALDDAHPRFNLETAERYRQEAARVANSRPPAH